MTYPFRNAVVIGAGTMGAAIAAHLANAGLKVTLLDIVPAEAQATGSAGARNKIVQSGVDRMTKARPANLFSASLAGSLRLGNLEDDFGAVADADWVLEAILEDLNLKRTLMQRVDEARKQDCIVSTNTSGIPVAKIAEERSQSFREHFLGTHFFNPPRYLKLLELVPAPDTLPAVLNAMADFGERRLGKGVVVCKDTPNFIANRVGSVTGAFLLDHVLKHGYTVPEVDAITGPLMGRPKTASFRLMDLVGVDIADHVRSNLADLIPEDTLAQSVLGSDAANALQQKLIERGWLGNKSGIGFYKTVQSGAGKEFWPLNLETLEHEAPGEKVRFDSIGKVREIEDLGERLKALLNESDRAAELVRAMLFFGFAYASACIPEIADQPKAIDDAVRWGFMHVAGPFEIWDALGVAETAEKMKVAGYPPAAWVEDMLAGGCHTFYQYEGVRKTSVYSFVEKKYVGIESGKATIQVQALKDSKKVVLHNDSATLFDMGDGIALAEFHTKMNALDTEIGLLLMQALDKVSSDFDGLVIGNDAENFSAGANLFLVVMQSQQGMWDELDGMIRGLQELNMRMRYFHKPVVVAPAGLTLGGGAEVMMHASRIVAHAELYCGLVELGAGVIPAGGGTKEMLRRVLNPMMRVENADALAGLEKIFLQVGQAKVATSALETREFGMLGEADRVVMNRDWLLTEAKREARHLADTGYVAPLPEKIYAAGRDMLAALKVGIFMFRQGGYISDYDVVVAEKLAKVMTGGDLSQPAWVDEQYILDMEREAFLALCGEEKTQQRMWSLLQTGKPLRN